MHLLTPTLIHTSVTVMSECTAVISDHSQPFLNDHCSVDKKMLSRFCFLFY